MIVAAKNVQLGIVTGLVTESAKFMPTVITVVLEMFRLHVILEVIAFSGKEGNFIN